MPTNRESRPRSESMFIWSRMPRSWSMNHQPLPHCTRPGTVPSWKEPGSAAKSALSAGLML